MILSLFSDNFKRVLGQLLPRNIAPPTLILTLTLNQTLTLTGGQFSSGAIVRTTVKRDILLYGDSCFDENKNKLILETTIIYIKNTERFSGCLFGYIHRKPPNN